MIFADVIIPLALADYFTYSIPDEFVAECEIGKRILVQFGRKKYYTAIIRKIHNNKPDYETKDIFSVIDSKPIINETHIRFWEWISEYFMATIGEVYAAAMPISLRIETQTQIFLIKEIFDEELSENEKIIVNALKNQKTLTISAISNLIDIKNPIRIVNKLLEKEIIDVYEHFLKGYKPKYEKFVKISPMINSELELQKSFDKISRAQKQTSILLAYSSLSKLKYDSGSHSFLFEEVKRKELLEKADSTGSVLNSLYEKQILVEYEKKKSRLAGTYDKEISFNKLSDVQKQAFDDIKETFKTKDVTLLHGITSSGKTEVYIHLIREYINKGKQVLYLLPEIALTSQIIERLKAAFGEIVGIYHSKFNDSERAEIWNKTTPNSDELNKYKIILGVRSAIFLPFDNLGLIIVDEEHETTYKQFDPAPRYNARDASVVLAKMFDAKVLMGTATPSIETYFNTKTGKFGLVEINKRHRNIELPEIVFADLKEARLKSQMKSIFHPKMIENIKEALGNGEQIILFQNRRGFSPYVECKTCGWIPKCVNCDVSLTYHIDSNDLVCHYCGYKQPVPSSCNSCDSIAMETRGFGTQKVEDEIKIFFPGVNVGRLDLDVSKRKHGYEEVISSFSSGEVDILVGTQMVTKGLDFENVSIVGVLNADNLLNFPDFRSYERAFQLITQVSGRAGRMHNQGKVVIQTAQPKHKILHLISQNSYSGLYEEELRERKSFSYPPFVRLIKITLKHKKEFVVNTFSEELALLLRKSFANRILGPQAPLIGRIQNYYLKEILLKFEPEASLPKAKKIIIAHTNQLKQKNNFSNVQVNFNVDPI
ncbi:MAG: primosomal protein N' [Bacteroidales bacterium]|nr:primosomal protein N' [Bacteroidales bacterium]